VEQTLANKSYKLKDISRLQSVMHNKQVVISRQRCRPDMAANEDDVSALSTRTVDHLQ